MRYLLALLFFTSIARADLITFEQTPTGATPVDDATLATPYNVTGGTVRFFFDANGNNRYDAGVDVLPIFEQIGSDVAGTSAFQSTTTSGGSDTARAGYESQLGNFFLRGTSAAAVIPTPFIAAYTTTGTIRALSGEIWDIDGRSVDNAEQWRVDVLNAADAVLATQLSPRGTSDGPESLDSLPWNFQFSNLPDGVSALRLTYVGNADKPGFAFNNFSPDVAVPEPACMLFAALPLMLRRRR